MARKIDSIRACPTLANTKGEYSVLVLVLRSMVLLLLLKHIPTLSFISLGPKPIIVSSKLISFGKYIRVFSAPIRNEGWRGKCTS